MKITHFIVFFNLFYFLLATPLNVANENGDVDDTLLENFDANDNDDIDDTLLENLDENYNNDSEIDFDVASDIFSVSKDVTLNLYRRQDPDYPFTLTMDNYQNAPLNSTLKTEIIVHGWLNDADRLWVLRMKDKYFLNGDYNVIVVDWDKYAKWEYTLATYKVKPIGEYIAKVLTPLIEGGKLVPEDIHIVGHCLGGHIAGFVGKTIQRTLEKNIGRITGLDVARSLYEFPILVSKKKRLVKEDALFVDVIHACGGNYGFKSAIGHVDFYPNGGTARQPGCSRLTPYLCSRGRSHEYYTESINTNNFLATRCTSWKSYKKGKCDETKRVVMGFHINTKATEGKYYLRTNKREPYSKG
ncbi:pancreatic lipase-related protein 2-like [Chrysoperla carnea]|uniref:pancreatic lipase-related protein 2-like n=1 Tax=Chrysoperla carnea TaxID=189513 RepID=UPI001D094369|nr:pancreatic lipase-related protein 2-like [Chrysoperla carnea]